MKGAPDAGLVTCRHPFPCSMLDREESSERCRFFVKQRGLSNHFACLAGAPAERRLALGRAAGRGRTPRLRLCALVLLGFAKIVAMARTKRRVIAVISRFSAGSP